MSPRKRDNKQFRDACREAGIRADVNRRKARDDLHRYKREIARREHFSYSELVEWLKEWSYTCN